jgi:regulator of replication initiation timing
LKEQVKGYEELVITLVEEKLELKKGVDQRDQELQRVKEKLNNLENLETVNVSLLAENVKMTAELTSLKIKIKDLLEIEESLAKEMTEKSKKIPRKKSDERAPMYDAWYYVLLLVNGAPEVSAEGGEGIVLGGKVHIHLL